MPEENEIVIPLPEGGEAEAKESAEMVELAQEMGWNPDFEESEGKEKLSPKDFIKKGRTIQKDMRKRIKSQSDSIEDLTSSMKGIQEHFSNVSKSEIAKAKKELKVKREEAIIDGDIDAVNGIDSEMESLKVQENGGKEGAREVSEFEKKWDGDNKWAIENTEMLDYANYKLTPFLRKNKDASVKDILEFSRETVEKKFPEYFGKDKQDRRPSASAVNEGGSRPGGNKNHTAADLTSEQRKIMRAFTKHGMMTEKEYISELKATGALK